MPIITPEWMQTNRKLQIELYQHFGQRKYDEISESLCGSMSPLFQKISFSLFGISDEEKTEDKEKEEKETVQRIEKKIIEVAKGKIYLNVVYISITELENNKSTLVPVFKVPKDVTGELQDNHQYVLVDSGCCVYKDWEDYLESNQLPKCAMCFPENGEYKIDKKDQRVALKYEYSSACSVKNKILSVTDTASKVLTGAFLGIEIGALFTPIGPIILGINTGVGAATGAYTFGRSVTKLYDKVVHEDPNIALGAVETIVDGVNVFSYGIRGTTKLCELLGKNSKIMERAKNLVPFLKWVNIISSPITLFNDIYALVSKAVKFTDQNIKKFTNAILMLYNTVVSTEVVPRLMDAIQVYTENCTNTLIKVGGLWAQKLFYKALTVTCENKYFKYLICMIVGEETYSYYNSKLQIETCKINTSLMNENFCKAIRESTLRCWASLENIVKDVNCAYHLKCAVKRNADILSNGTNIKPISIILMNKIRIYIKTKAEIFEPDPDKREDVKRIERLLIQRFDVFNSRKKVTDFYKYFVKLQVFCEHIESRYENMKEEYQNDLDIEEFSKSRDRMDYLRSKNTNKILFTKSLQMPHLDLIEIETEYEERMKHENPTTIQHYSMENEDLGKIIPFYLPEGKCSLNSIEKLEYASDLSGYTFNDENSNVTAYDEYFTVVARKVDCSSHPTVFLFLVNNDDIETMGLAIIKTGVRELFKGNIKIEPSRDFESHPGEPNEPMPDIEHSNSECNRCLEINNIVLNTDLDNNNFKICICLNYYTFQLIVVILYIAYNILFL
uniref:DUF4781 domain-containing protein n=1 Tax=Clastoptera arizonana TaxID=38151 RepID=A0A1B6E885_9HEMI